MPKKISLRKIWHLCNTTLKNNMQAKDILITQNAYKLLLSNTDETCLKLTANFGHSLHENQIEKLCLNIEKVLNLPVRDGDFLVTKNDHTKAQSPQCQLIFYLHDIRSGFNIGSMIRIADGFNIKKVILSGYTACVDNTQVKRSSLGSEINIATEHDNQHLDLLKSYKNEGYKIIALETVNNSQNVVNYSYQEKSLIIVGNERNGLSDELLQYADDIVHIPMFGTKNSLNVTSALSMASYEWVKQWR